jgi:hypothetical protein
MSEVKSGNTAPAPDFAALSRAKVFIFRSLGITSPLAAIRVRASFAGLDPQGRERI